MRLPRLLALAVFAAIGAMVLVADLGFRNRFMALMGAIPGEDATVHFVLMGLLVAAAIWGFSDGEIRGRRVGTVGVTLIVLVIVTLEELSQAWLPARDASLTDMIASHSGIVFAAFVLAALRRAGPSD
jgi:hypothetical protein